jgi:hypothetical protein
MTKEEVEELQKAKEKISVSRELIWSLVDTEIENPCALFSFNSEPLIFENSLILVQGKQGSHKSRITAALASLALSGFQNIELMGFKFESFETYKVIYVDTERNNKQQIPLMIKQIMKETNLDKNELRKVFEVVPLNEINRDMRLKAVNEEFKLFRAEKKNKVIIIMDVISDFISDFNNLIQTNTLVDLLNSGINVSEITFILVLHENPGIQTDKPRGHLGTELQNKVSTNIRITEEKDTKGIFSLSIRKSRSTAIPKPIYLKFDSDTGNLIRVDSSEVANKSRDKDLFLLKEWFFNIEKLEFSRVEIITKIKNHFKWAERTIEDKLKSLVEEKVELILNSSPNLYILTKERSKETNYKLVIVENESDTTLPSIDNLEKHSKKNDLDEKELFSN